MLVVSSIGQGMLWAILGLGIFMTFRILDFPDMTTEGSFPLGGAVAVTAINYGVHPIFATLLGFLGGMVAGLVTGLLYTKGKIPTLLAGILVMTGLNSVMLFIMGQANLSLLGKPKIQNMFNGLHLPGAFNIVLLGLISLVLIIGLMLFFFDTNLGQAYIATGDNENMARSIGINTDNMQLLGLTLSNGVIALSGALVCQNDGYADINKGVGVIVIGLASIIVGEVLFGELTMSERLIAIVVGSIFYQLLILAVIKAGLNTNYLKIFSSIILAICLMVPEIRKKLKINLSRSASKEVA
ncbi:MAG: ABC transporter permease [Lactobacillales bacterium]|jgi:putative ABC transport system permease protein|nr:ABC transporter permease [Lactobacillales bacterium]